MADQTIHGLTQILSAAVVASTDEVPLWDDDAATTKRLAIDNIPIAVGQISGVLTIAQGGTGSAVGNVVVDYTDGPVTLTTSDAGKTVTMTSADTEVINLPSVAAAQKGMQFTIVKLGAGQVTIQAADSDIIVDSSAGGTILNSQAAEVYATITLRLVTATLWTIVGMIGTWTTT